MLDEVTFLGWRMAQSEMAIARLEGEIANTVAVSKMAALKRLKASLGRATLVVDEVGASGGQVRACGGQGGACGGQGGW